MKIFLFIFAIFFSFQLTGAAHAEATDVIIQDIKSLGISTKRYETILAQFFSEARAKGDITESINLNGDYDSQAINVFVIEEPSSTEKDTYIPSLRINQSAVSENFAAINNDLLLIGESALAQSYLSSFNEVLSILHSENMIGTAILGDPYQYHQAMTTYLDFGNIAALKSDGPRLYDEDGTPWGQDPLATLRKTATTEFELNPFVYVTLSFIFQHELAHLADGQPGSFSSFDQLLKGFYDWRILRSETSADSEAFDRIAEILSRNKDSVAIYSIVGLANNLRNQLLYRYFEGVGGIAARDRFVSLMHNGCDDDRIYSYGLRRDNVNLVMAGYLSPLPILTTEEYLNIQERIVHDNQRVTHPHNLVRAQQIITEIDSFTEDGAIPASYISTVLPYLGMLRALEDGEPYINYEYFGSETGVKIAEFLPVATRHFSVQNSMSCTADLDCFVGVSEVGGRIEFASSEGNLVYATLYLPVDVSSNYPADEPISNEVVNTLVEFFGVPRILVDRDFETITPAVVAQDAISELTSCGFHWSMYFSLDGFFEIATLEAKKSLQIRFFPARYDVFRASIRE